MPVWGFWGDAGTIAPGVPLTDRGTLSVARTLINRGLISGMADGLDGGSGGTIVNAGTITGGSDSVRFTVGSSSRLVVEPGAVFGGLVLANGGVLEFAPGESGLADLGTACVGFGKVVVDSGATETLGSEVAVGSMLVSGAVTVVAGGNLGLTSMRLSGAVGDAPRTLVTGAPRHVAVRQGTRFRVLAADDTALNQGVHPFEAGSGLR